MTLQIIVSSLDQHQSSRCSKYQNISEKSEEKNKELTDDGFSGTGDRSKES